MCRITITNTIFLCARTNSFRPPHFFVGWSVLWCTGKRAPIFERTLSFIPLYFFRPSCLSSYFNSARKLCCYRRFGGKGVVVGIEEKRKKWRVSEDGVLFPPFPSSSVHFFPLSSSPSPGHVVMLQPPCVSYCGRRRGESSVRSSGWESPFSPHPPTTDSPKLRSKKRGSRKKRGEGCLLPSPS